MAYFELSLQLAACCLAALDVKLTDTGRSIRAGVLMPGFFDVYYQLPHSVAPIVDQLPKRVPGAVMVEQGGQSGSFLPASEEGGATCGREGRSK